MEQGSQFHKGSILYTKLDVQDKHVWCYRLLVPPLLGPAKNMPEYTIVFRKKDIPLMTQGSLSIIVSYRRTSMAMLPADAAP